MYIYKLDKAGAVHQVLYTAIQEAWNYYTTCDKK